MSGFAGIIEIVRGPIPKSEPRQEYKDNHVVDFKANRDLHVNFLRAIDGNSEARGDFQQQLLMDDEEVFNPDKPRSHKAIMRYIHHRSMMM